MQSDSQCAICINPFTTTMTDRVRTTISLDPEVHSIFVRMAEAAGTSVSRCMGDWLADTAEGAQFVALKMQEARRAPKAVMREFQALSRGLVEEVDAIAQKYRSEGLRRIGAGRAEPTRAEARTSPPSSNTGGKVPRENPGKRGRKAV
jgi:hypothetical protein